MRCPKCGFRDDKVIDSRQSRDSSSIRRRRVCLQCAYRFTTYEQIERSDLRVVMDIAADLSLSGDARRELRRLGRGLVAQLLGRLLDVATGVLERLPAVEHAGTGSLSELAKKLHGDVRHEITL